MQISVKRLAEDWAVRRLSLCTRSDTELTPLAQSLLEHLEGEGEGPVFTLTKYKGWPPAGSERLWHRR